MLAGSYGLTSASPTYTESITAKRLEISALRKPSHTAGSDGGNIAVSVFSRELRLANKYPPQVIVKKELGCGGRQK